MSIEITVRHVHMPVDVQDYAKEKAGILLEAFPRIEHIHVIMDVQRHLHVAEVVAQGRMHVRVEAEESSDNMRVSIDRAFDRIERQVRKLEDKAQDHRHARKPGDISSSGEK